MRIASYPDRGRAPALLVLALVALLVAGCCGTPAHVRLPEGSVVQPILDRYEQVVAEAEAGEHGAWQSGWTGNIWVNSGVDSSRGLCHEWRDLVWNAVVPVARELGWDALGIRINGDSLGEHHAVVVYDARRVSRSGLLDPGVDVDRALVLDPWKCGTPAVYSIADWLERPTFVWAPPQIVNVYAPVSEQAVAPVPPAPAPAPNSATTHDPASISP